jgi:hypothetical protein
MQKPGLFGMSGFLLFLLTCCSNGLRAQQGGNLIIIDADNKSPFTVHVGDQLFASSGHGHLVIPHLKDSTYKLGVRFPKKALPEQVFPIQIKQKDIGFQLQGSDSSWVLYNWQAKTTIRPVKDHDSSRILEMGVKREDGFSRLMAAVVDDTAVMYNTYTGSWFTKDSLNQIAATSVPSVPASAAGSAKSGKQTNNPRDSSVVKTVQPVASQPIPVPVPPGGKASKEPVVVNKQPSKPLDSALVKNDKTVVPNATAAVSVAKAKLPGKPSIKKMREVNLKISRKMVFLDTGPDGNVDTVTLFVYFENKDSIKKQAAGAMAARKNQTAIDSAGTAAHSKTAGAEVFIRGCGEQATTGDVEWLRSAILKANAEQEKIAAASTAFSLKCFSVSQLRILAALFVSDKARYKLMEAAKQHISDKDHFRELADMYTDKNFQKKFLVMADKRS